MAPMKLSVAPRVMIVTLFFLGSALPVRCSQILQRESRVHVIKPEVVVLLLVRSAAAPRCLSLAYGGMVVEDKHSISISVIFRQLYRC